MSRWKTSISSLSLGLWLAACGCGDVESMGVDAAGNVDAMTDAATTDAFVGSWSLTDMLPGTANPNGPWAYGWSATLGGTLNLLTMMTTDVAHPGWIDPDHVTAGAPQIWINQGTTPSNGVPVGAASMHPGLANEYVVARFTAPAAGRYTATMQAFEGDAGPTDATARVDGTLGTTVDVDAANPMLNIPATALAAGDTLELWIGPKGDGAGDNTPVTFMVQAVP